MHGGRTKLKFFSKDDKRPYEWSGRDIAYRVSGLIQLKVRKTIGRETRAEVLIVPPSVGGVKEITDYFSLFDYDINLLVNAIKKTGTK
jgi:hypothetical protein